MTEADMREVTVVNRKNGTPVLDLDPVMVETTVDRDVALPESGALMDLWDAMIAYELEFEVELALVWTDSMLTSPVKALCPVCDDVARVDHEMAVEDLGTDPQAYAMVCADCLD